MGGLVGIWGFLSVPPRFRFHCTEVAMDVYAPVWVPIKLDEAIYKRERWAGFDHGADNCSKAMVYHKVVEQIACECVNTDGAGGGLQLL